MYDYQKEKLMIFSEESQLMFLGIRDRVNRLLSESGAVRMQEAIKGNVGSTWRMMACVDRLVELGELIEITQENTPGQYRVFVKGKNNG